MAFKSLDTFLVRKVLKDKGQVYNRINLKKRSQVSFWMKLNSLVALVKKIIFHRIILLPQRKWNYQCSNMLS